MCFCGHCVRACFPKDYECAWACVAVCLPQQADNKKRKNRWKGNLYKEEGGLAALRGLQPLHELCDMVGQILQLLRHGHLLVLCKLASQVFHFLCAAPELNRLNAVAKKISRK
jgi:hypothetical protein